MKKPEVFGFYGRSGSGKTRLIVDLIKRLTDEGLKVASVKISDKKIDLDVKGKDTWMYAKFGSALVVLSSACSTDFLLKKNQGIKRIIDQISAIDNFDVILVEGANDDFTKKIRTGAIKERKNTILTYKGDFEQLIKLIKNERSRSKNMDKIIIKVNGKQIQLTEFPKDIIKNTICGMLKSLKGVEEIKKVEICLEL